MQLYIVPAGGGLAPCARAGTGSSVVTSTTTTLASGQASLRLNCESRTITFPIALHRRPKAAHVLRLCSLRCQVVHHVIEVGDCEDRNPVGRLDLLHR